MNKRLLLLLLLSLFAMTGYAVNRVRPYDSLIKAAHTLHNAKEFQKAAAAYTEAFKSQGWIGDFNDRYSAACSWAMAGNADSALFQLYRIATKVQYAEYNQVRVDRDLLSLRADARWQPLLEIIRQNKERKQRNLDKQLIAMLDSVYIDDQEYRLIGQEIIRKYGMNAKETIDFIRLINEKDSVNLVKIRSILDSYGWLGADKIGDEGNNTLFLVIQHANLQVQQKYLPMMRAAEKMGHASSAQLALLEDRVALGEGRKQIYGSQIGMNKINGAYYVEPLDDPEHVDKRRAGMGLPPMQEYLEHWGLKWDVKDYKQDEAKK